MRAPGETGLPTTHQQPREWPSAMRGKRWMIGRRAERWLGDPPVSRSALAMSGGC